MEFIKNLFNIKSAKPKFERLPNNVIPKRYEISFKTDFESNSFYGTETISLSICKSTKEILINSVDLEITNIELKSELNSILSGAVTYQNEEEKIKLTFDEEIPVGHALLSFSFSGELAEASMQGYYISKYKDTKGKSKIMASTHFEPTSARRAFPCWDEPSFKATFIISMLIPNNMLAFSNMPEVSNIRDEEEPGFSRITFQETLLMSSYLVGYVVGELEYIEQRDSNNLLIRVIAPKGKAIFGKFALDLACKTVPFLGEFFDHKFELPKIDFVAVPEFASGAMENWGLIICRNTTLLINPDLSTIHAKMLVGLIVCHELGHMWFGNVVTMQWWTDLWLKEGFATWIEYYAFDYCCPQYDIWSYNICNDLSACMEVDALKHSHPIEVEVNCPTQINTIFDAISYMKGCALIRMLKEYVGDDNFKEGLRVYINRYKYSNANTADLWGALEEASGKPIGEIMTTWTTQCGFPIVRCVPVRNSNDCIKSIQISQTQYFTSGSHYHNNNNSASTSAPKSKKRKLMPTLWQIPISIVALEKERNDIENILLTKETSTVKIKVKNLTAFRANPLAFGYYRVWYDEKQLFDQIVEKVISKELGVTDRLKFLEDCYSFGLSGTIPLTDVLHIFRRLANEDENSCWNIVRELIYAVRNLLEDSDHSLDFLKQYVYRLFLPVYRRLGWTIKKNASLSTRQLQNSVITVLGRHSHPEVVKECRIRFENHLKKDPLLEPNFKTPVFSTIAVNGTVSDINKLKKLYSKSPMQEEKVRILRAMGFSPSKYHSEHIHSFILSDDVRMQDKLFGIICCCWCSNGRELAWKLIKDNWSQIIEGYQGSFLLHHLIEGVTKFASKSYYADDIENLLNENLSVDRSLNQLIEHIRNNVERLKRENNNVYEYLSLYYMKDLVDLVSDGAGCSHS